MENQLRVSIRHDLVLKTYSGYLVEKESRKTSYGTVSAVVVVTVAGVVIAMVVVAAAGRERRN